MAPSPSPKAPDASRDRERLLVALVTVAISVGGVVLFAFVPWSDWRTGLGLNAVENAILIGWAITRRDRVMAHLILFGLALGVAELVADATLVEATRTLDYSIGGGPMIWRSPIWMPLAWEVVAVQFGCIGMALWQRLGAPGLLLTGAIGAVNIPFYEEMALRTHWWQYSACRMLLHTPYYIIAGEFLIALAIGALARYSRAAGPLPALVAGAAGGLAILPCYALPFWLIDRLL